MIRQTLLTAFLAGIAAASVSTALAAAQDTANVRLKNQEGNDVGAVELRQVPAGVLLHARFDGLPAGTHAFHVHETGTCEPPFTSAGGHFNPSGATHGFERENGPHAGDMPNIHVPESGRLEVEVLNTRLQLDDALFDSDGAALVIHRGADDYSTDPAGAAGPRIACGVIVR